MIHILAGAFGFLAAFLAHDLAAQALKELPLRPGLGTCPACGHARGWLTRNCPECGRATGREWLFAATSAAVAVGFANTFQTEWVLVAYLAFLLLTLALGITDIDALRIVDRLNLRGTVVVALLLTVTALVDGNSSGIVRAALAALAYFAGTNLMFILVRGKGFGYGDVKLSVQLGLFTGYLSWGTLGWAVLVTALIGGGISIVILGAAAVASWRSSGDEQQSIRDSMRVEMPYGPPMIIGAWLAIVLAGMGAFPIPS